MTGVELLVNATAVDGPAGSCTGSVVGSPLTNYIHRLSGSRPYRQSCVLATDHSPTTDDGSPEQARAVFNHATLVGYYPSLQYQCSQVSGGVLCDYSVDPPLSVDAEGRYLDRKSLSKQRTANVYVASLTTKSIEYAVIAMLAVAFVAIFGTLAVLGGTHIAYEGLRKLGKIARKGLHDLGKFVEERVLW